MDTNNKKTLPQLNRSKSLNDISQHTNNKKTPPQLKRFQSLNDISQHTNNKKTPPQLKRSKSLSDILQQNNQIKKSQSDSSLIKPAFAFLDSTTLKSTQLFPQLSTKRQNNNIPLENKNNLSHPIFHDNQIIMTQPVSKHYSINNDDSPTEESPLLTRSKSDSYYLDKNKKKDQCREEILTTCTVGSCLLTGSCTFIGIMGICTSSTACAATGFSAALAGGVVNCILGHKLCNHVYNHKKYDKPTEKITTCSSEEQLYNTNQYETLTGTTTETPNRH